MSRRPLAIAAAATMALGGLFFAQPALAAETADETQPAADQNVVQEAPESDAPPAEVVEAAETAAEAGVEIVAYGVNAAGEDVVVVTSDSADEDAAVEAFTETADLDGATVVTVSGLPSAFADGEVVGGQGYAGIGSDDFLYACSVGFTGFAPDGTPALIGAGHCAYDQTGTKISQTVLTIPNQEPAVGGEGYEVEDPAILLGTFGFAQFGGTGNAPGSDGDANATDISVIDLNDAAGYDLLPEVTNWTTAGAGLGSLADATVSVTAVGAAKAGAVSKSGRTTGFTTGAVSATHVVDGWAQIEDRWVRGFSSNVIAGPGDSGGSVIQGTTAVGVISGGIEAGPGVEQWTWATSLVHGLPKTGGYEVALDLSAPAVTTPASGSTTTVGATITGTAPGAETIEVTGVGAAFDVPVNSGAFSFAAPGTPGDYSYTLTSVNGFSTSAPSAYSLTVEAAPTPTPTITSPTTGSTATSTVTTVSGTGVPTAAVVLTVDGTDYDATVGASGTWTVTGLDLTYGSHTVSVVQTLNGDESAAATSSFSVVPATPVVSSITNGQEFQPEQGPESLSGTGIDGATVTVVLTGTEPASARAGILAALSGTFTAEVVDGAWTVDFPVALDAGSYAASVTQAIAGVSSAPASLSFRVLDVTAPGGGGGGAGDGDGGAVDGGDGTLAETGVDLVAPITITAGALILLAGGAVLMMRRRTLAQD